MSYSSVPEGFFPQGKGPGTLLPLRDLLRNIRAVQQLNLSDDDIQQIHDFLRALYPDRVAFEAAGWCYPFDIDAATSSVPVTYTAQREYNA